MANQTIPELANAVLATGHYLPVATTAALDATKTTVDGVTQIIQSNYLSAENGSQAANDGVISYKRFHYYFGNFLISGAKSFKVMGTGYIGKIIGGEGFDNSAEGTNAAVVGGLTNTAGGQLSFIGGGTTNTTTALYSFIGGGFTNQIFGDPGVGAESVIVGGALNKQYATDGFIGGGFTNILGGIGGTLVGGTNNIGTGRYVSIIGGLNNLVSGDQATSIGGFANSASGNRSLVAGTMSKALHSGAFVFSDGRETPKVSAETNSIAFYFTGGAHFSGTHIYTSGANIYLNGELVTIPVASPTISYKGPGTIYVDYTQTGTQAETANGTVLKRYTVPANTLAKDGDRLKVQYSYTGSQQGSPKLYFKVGSDLITPIQISPGNVEMVGSASLEILRTSSTTVYVNGVLAATIPVIGLGEQFEDSVAVATGINITHSSSFQVLMSGINTSAQKDGLVGKTMSVEYWPV